MGAAMLAERVFGPKDYCPENSIAYAAADGGIVGLSLIVPPQSMEIETQLGPVDGLTESVAGIRWFGVDPDYYDRGIGTRMMDESCRLLIEKEASIVQMLATPPFYIRPGVDVRLTNFIDWLSLQGFQKYDENYNMNVDLRGWNSPGTDEIFDVDSGDILVRRASGGDRELLHEFCRATEVVHWEPEALLGIEHDPSSLFLAIHQSSTGERIGTEKAIGFSVYDANQCVGCFGPTGVDPAYRGRGVGTRLLWACLLDLKNRGCPVCEIGWLGPGEFYERAVGAVAGARYCAMQKRLVG